MAVIREGVSNEAGARDALAINIAAAGYFGTIIHHFSRSSLISCQMNAMADFLDATVPRRSVGCPYSAYATFDVGKPSGAWKT